MRHILKNISSAKNFQSVTVSTNALIDLKEKHIYLFQLYVTDILFLFAIIHLHKINRNYLDKMTI